MFTTGEVAELHAGRCRRSGQCGQAAALGRPNPNAVKFFSAVELIALLADREWLDEATKTIGQFWKRKNAQRQSNFSLTEAVRRLNSNNEV